MFIDYIDIILSELYKPEKIIKYLGFVTVGCLVQFQIFHYVEM